MKRLMILALLSVLTLSFNACQKEVEIVPDKGAAQGIEQLSSVSDFSHPFLQSLELSFNEGELCSYGQSPSNLVLATQSQLATEEQERPGILDFLREYYGQPDWGSYMEEDSLNQGAEALSFVPIIQENQDSVHALLAIYQELGQGVRPVFFRRDAVQILLQTAAVTSVDYETAVALDSLFLIYDELLYCNAGTLEDRCGRPSGCKDGWLRRLWKTIKNGFREAFHAFYDANNPGGGNGGITTYIHGIYGVGGGGTNSGEGPNTGGVGGWEFGDLCAFGYFRCLCAGGDD